MKRSSAPFVAAILAFAVPHAFAQGHDERCTDFVAEHCGKTGVGACFAEETAWKNLPEHCTGDVQTMIEMESEALEQQAVDTKLERADVRDVVGNAYGRSYGGQLRSGPGTSHTKVASVAEGERIRILENTGVEFDGYVWYRVLTVHGEGFHWGGVFCSDGEKKLDGVLTICGSAHEASLFGGG